ncbi:MAG: hypothetical protein SFU99_19885 [Saprospiraceae bacterium]|nr:hypothetical protein [Saprospiraceae bacterium]
MADNLTALSIFKTDINKYQVTFFNNYNRLEISTRVSEFEDSLRAEVRDPLWMLCRQWQFGEFQGEDAGTAYQAKILGTHFTPQHVELFGDKRINYKIDKPLETLVEREILAPDLYLRAQMGRHLIKLMKQHDLNVHIKLIRTKYPLNENPETDDKEGSILSVSLNGRLPDGFLAYQEMLDDRFLNWVNNTPQISSATQKENFKDVQDAFLRWFGYLYEQPGIDESAWRAEHLEYNFALELTHDGALQDKLIADQYASGRLEWYAFDRTSDKLKPNGGSDQNAFTDILQVFLPTALEFVGMPNPRYWQMEENQIDFGKLDASPTGLLGVLLAEYGLTYSNDWFLLPYEMDINTLCEVKGILIEDVFGFNLLVKPAINDPELDFHEFAVFHHTERNKNTIGKSLFYLTPSVGQLQEGDPLEKVNFMRDEMSNMVWAIENRIPSAAGFGRDVKRKTPRLPQDFEPADEESKIRYVLGSTVPENWIPFIPVHKKPNNLVDPPSEIRLQRARLPQAPPPKSKLLSEIQPVFFVEEEEVPRAGVIIKRSFQRTRWLNGKTYLWVGRRKMAGRGEGWSGLMFDQILDIKS